MENMRYKAYKKIKNMIVFLDLKPGQKIIESEIAKRIKIGRTPVREALLMLETEKLVVAGGKKGFAVRALSSGEIKEYFKMRMLLEEFAFPLIIERITSSEKNAIKKNFVKTEEAIKNGHLRDVIFYETKYHEILYKATKSEIFIETIFPLVDKFQLLRAISLNVKNSTAQSFQEHKQIFEAIERKDEQGFRRLIKEHLTHAEENVAHMRGLFFNQSIF
ncbi:MAG: GntR family transcriptional regulator [Deltaproteobacteria bacterium]|nr:GntR family transcriptional regulator [Deltaproteobacteria bacterium]